MSEIPQKLQILLISDDPMDFSDLQAMVTGFRDTEVDLEWARGASAGRARISEGRPGVCLLSREAGPEDGLTLLRELHALEPEVPIVFLHSNPDRLAEAEALRAGASECLVREQMTPYVLERSICHSLFRQSVKRENLLRESERMIQERLAAVGLLASGMGHEIGTPLGVIRGRAEVQLGRVAGDAALVRDLEIIISQVDRVSRLMRSLLNLARGDRLGPGGELELKVVVNEVLEVMSQALRDHGIRVYNDVPSSVRIRARADGEPFHQILMSLLTNSMQAIATAMEKGRREGHSIRLSVEEEGGNWALRICDSGCGISPENQRKLFRPFFTTKGVGRGTGLGLALSLRIVESWKGSIRVESTPEKGATFIVSVPKCS